MFRKDKRKSKPHRYDTLIAQGTEIQGDIVFSGGLHIDGMVKGELSTRPDDTKALVRVSQIGEIHGDVRAPHVIINGKVHGDVYSTEHIELAPKASITGNVYYNLLEMAMGAEVNGNLVHQQQSTTFVEKTFDGNLNEDLRNQAQALVNSDRDETQ